MAALLVFGAGVLGQHSVAHANAVASTSDFEGVYRMQGGTKKKAEIRRIIDIATEDMSIVIRDYARGRLYETTEPLSLLVMKFPGDKISVGYLGEKAIVTPSDGTKVKWKNRLGDRTNVAQTMEGGKLVQRYTGAAGGGKRTSIYTLSEDGSRITVDTTVTATLMPKPVKFRVTYVRR